MIQNEIIGIGIELAEDGVKSNDNSQDDVDERL